MADNNPTISVFVPWPPSVNRIWRHHGKRTYKNPKYVAWEHEAGWAIKLAKCGRIKGPFSAEIALTPPDKRKGDMDNRIKVLLDLAQKQGLIENDHLCRQLMVRYDLDATTPGACVILKPVRD